MASTPRQPTQTRKIINKQNWSRSMSIDLLFGVIERLFNDHPIVKGEPLPFSCNDSPCFSLAKSTPSRYKPEKVRRLVDLVFPITRLKPLCMCLFQPSIERPILDPIVKEIEGIWITLTNRKCGSRRVKWTNSEWVV